MKQRGFISSALLYGMLALFLVIMLSTLAILGNRKLSMDKLKENALKEVQIGYTKPESLYAVYDGFQVPVGNTWKDQSGNGNTATLFGTTKQQDNLLFNGTSDYIDSGIGQQDLGKNFTISMVVNMSSDTVVRGLWGLKTGISARSENTIMKLCEMNTSNVETCLETPSSHFKGSKKQITAVYQSGVGITVYVNGTTHTANKSITTNIKPVGNLIIGKSEEKAGYFKGNLYNVSIYTEALTKEEVLANYLVDKEKYGL